MKDQDYKIQLLVDISAEDAFKLINSVEQWWTDDLEGSTHNLNDVFTVRFGDIHVSTQKIIEVIPNEKLVWLVTDSNLNFVEKKHEWTNTKIVFELTTDQNNMTHIHFTHIGLIPGVQCYEGCTKGWDYYITGSLFKLLTEGLGTPGL